MGIFDYLFENNITSLPNIEMKTLGGEVFWDTVKSLPGGYRVQRNCWDHNHYRILDVNNVRVSYGSKKVVENYINRFLQSTNRVIKRGDIIAVDQNIAGVKIYQHFGVYIGDYTVIHFNNNERGRSTKDYIPYIHKATIDDFLSGRENLYVLEFDNLRKDSWQFKGIITDNNSNFTNKGLLSFFDINRLGKNIKEVVLIKLIEDVYNAINDSDYHIYSSEETVKRAESKIGEGKYNLGLNNCEHFAIWCKTGLHKSEQIDKLLKTNIWKEVIK